VEPFDAMADDVKKWITFAELADQCRGVVSEVTLRRYVRAGRIAHAQPGGRKGKLLFPADVLEQLFRSESSPHGERPTSELAPATPKKGRPQWARRAPNLRKED
jgi:hypothetical protein